MSRALVVDGRDAAFARVRDFVEHGAVFRWSRQSGRGQSHGATWAWRVSDPRTCAPRSTTETVRAQIAETGESAAGAGDEGGHDVGDLPVDGLADTVVALHAGDRCANPDEREPWAVRCSPLRLVGADVDHEFEVGTHGGRVGGRREAGDDMSLEDHPAGHRRVASACGDHLDARPVPAQHGRHLVDDAGVVVADQVERELRPAPLIGGGIRAGVGGDLEHAVEVAKGAGQVCGAVGGDGDDDDSGELARQLRHLAVLTTSSGLCRPRNRSVGHVSVAMSATRPCIPNVVMPARSIHPVAPQ